ncbi:curli production assembly/transport component CsgF [Mongoliitalea daihaiensis]|uniref:curli production assembly/transport component CsgF n=1 Tax=Mongoliitalea daihaiensis TaxID=2782006 RepID=UPI001F17BAD7|nr:curli production assembly/transport component CsgF [Mongoliitalea daihaiensis]UJP65718.1 curli assembly protein CsgF [Mongoliitalea daihaiensis]
MKKVFVFTLFLSLISFAEVFSQQLVYTPRNPAFGGNTFNYQWLLSSAQAQDTTRDPNQTDRGLGFSRDPLQEFSESLNRQILSRLSRELVTRQFGEGSIEQGTYILGDFQIEISDGGRGLNITIVDIRTGATTVVEVPFF